MANTSAAAAMLKPMAGWLLVLTVVGLLCTAAGQDQDTGRSPLTYRLAEQESPATFVGNVATAWWIVPMRPRHHLFSDLHVYRP